MVFCALYSCAATQESLLEDMHLLSQPTARSASWTPIKDHPVLVAKAAARQYLRGHDSRLESVILQMDVAKITRFTAAAARAAPALPAASATAAAPVAAAPVAVVASVATPAADEADPLEAKARSILKIGPEVNGACASLTDTSQKSPIVTSECLDPLCSTVQHAQRRLPTNG